MRVTVAELVSKCDGVRHSANWHYNTNESKPKKRQFRQYVDAAAGRSGNVRAKQRRDQGLTRLVPRLVLPRVHSVDDDNRHGGILLNLGESHARASCVYLCFFLVLLFWPVNKVLMGEAKILTAQTR